MAGYSKGFSYLVDVFLIGGILVSGFYFVRDNQKILRESAEENDGGEEIVFEGVLPLTDSGHPVRNVGTFGSTYKISVALSYSRKTLLSHVDGDKILLQLPKASTSVLS